MITTHSSQKGDPHTRLPLPGTIQENIYPFYHEVNITDGSEFLDDTLRMTDQPLGEVQVTKITNPFVDDDKYKYF